MVFSHNATLSLSLSLSLSVYIYRERDRGEVTNVLDCDIVASSNSIDAITFTLGQISLGKAWNSLSPFLLVK